ncbi:LmeA family phospholipid-binding protein [Kineosporia succinea]|uniref:DUF2993 family protein n=1 Tax=Kineosporia succinea TaxID=84632 RepID=A0ABT9PE80_9ACTN|nr:DUF2993 domain-containing protein [Kineosporia succinea]MDP9830777.1 hypothetical protein [Kineosporia succinea]
MSRTGTGAPAAGSGRAATRPRWHRPAVVAAGVVVVLLGLVVAADVVVARQVRGRIVASLRCATGTADLTPDVSLGGTPVLLQLLSGHLGRVSVSGVPSSALGDGATGQELPVTGDVDLILSDVTPGRPPSIGAATATVTVDWDALTDRLTEAAPALDGATLGEQAGMLAVRPTRQVMGRSVQLLMSLSTEKSSLVLTPTTVVIGDRRIQASLLTGLLGESGADDQLAPRTVDLDLPEGAALVSAGVSADGLVVGTSVDVAAFRGTGSGPAC